MHSAWFRSTFLRVLKFLQIKEGGPNFWGEPILQKVWIIWSPLLYFNFKVFMDPNSSSFIRSQCILHHRGVLFSESWNFYKLKRGDVISGGNWFCRKSQLFGRAFCISILKDLWTQRGDLVSPRNQFCRKSKLFGRPLLYLNFKSFVDPNSSSFIRSECILHDGGVLFWESWNFYKLKRGDLSSGGNQFCRMSELFGPLFCISILKDLWTHIFCHSLDLNAFFMI